MYIIPLLYVCIYIYKCLCVCVNVCMNLCFLAKKNTQRCLSLIIDHPDKVNYNIKELRTLQKEK